MRCFRRATPREIAEESTRFVCLLFCLYVEVGWFNRFAWYVTCYMLHVTCHEGFSQVQIEWEFTKPIQNTTFSKARVQSEAFKSFVKRWPAYFEYVPFFVSTAFV